MSRTVPWSIKDISFDARQLARDAAQRSGVSVGDWLDALIADHAPEALLIPSNGGSVAASRKAKAVVADSSADEAHYELAATGTDGPLRRFAVGERRIVHVFDAAVDGTGSPPDVVADSLTASMTEEAVATSADPAAQRSISSPVQPAPEEGRTKEQMIREAVADITRRQAMLEDGMPPRENLPPLPRFSPDGATLGEIGDALSALETRLASARASRVEGPGAASLPRAVQVPTGLDQEASRAFDTLGRDLRRAVQDIDLRVRPNAAGRAEALPRFEDRFSASQDLLSSTARVPQTGGARPAPSPEPSHPPSVSPVARSDPDGLLNDVKALLERLGPGSSMDVLDRRMQDLASQMERHLDAPPSAALIENLGRRIDALQASVKAPGIEPQAFDSLLRGIEERVGKAQAASADIEQLEKMMNSLATRIEEASHHPDVKALSALEGQIERLGERLERSEANLSSLDAVEHSLRELFSQLEQTRYATIDAAENAARTAARDTLRAAMQNPAVTASSALRSDLADKIAQDVHDLRAQHDAAERRTQTALGSLHQAVAKLVDRLERGEVTQADTASRQAAAALEPAIQEPANRVGNVPDVIAVEDGSDRRRASDRSGQASTPASDLADGLIEPGEARGLGRVQNTGLDKAELAGHDAGLASSVMPADGSAPFIAAARRAAQAAQASAASKQKALHPRDGSAGAPARTASSAMALLDRTRVYLADRRRPILLGLASLVVLLGALEVVKIERGSSTAPVASADSLRAPDAVDATAGPKTDRPADATLSEPAGSPVAEKAADRATGEAPAVNPPPAAMATAASPDAHPSSAAAKPNQAFKSANPFLASVAPPLTGLSDGLKSLALGGDPAAEYEVGLRYVEGRTVNRDPKTAASWFEKAATRGLAPAQYRLGSAYEKGVGEVRDPAQAVAWYGRAADAGNIRAMHNLAVMSAEGAVGKPDYVKAATLFGKAAAFGVRDSQFNLAILYARGLGIEQNLAQSYTWFAIAAAQGDDDAAKKRDEVAAKLDAKTLEAAKAAADNFRPVTPSKAANDVPPPAGGWDAVASPARSDLSGQKTPITKASIL